MARRFPQMHVSDPQAYGIFEPNSGVLMARRAVAAVVQDAVRHGVEYRRAAVQGPVENGFVRTIGGEEIRANTFICACGPWLPKLFPDLLGNRMFCTRQEVFFFAPPAGDVRFNAGTLPVWLDFTDPRGPYGFPDLECRGFKLAFDRHGPAFDPDADDRRVSAEGLAEARRFLAERFPSMRDAPLAESRVCQYENTSNGDFLIDRHPRLENVWLVGGGSGHGFKHGPAVGEYVHDCILKGAREERRFLLETKGQTLSRTVY
jgi:glycine/D-amino acid oxidase-like deaminating enzyme